MSQLTRHCLFVIFFINNNTVFTRLGLLQLFPVSKTEETHERTEICYEERFRRRCPTLYQKVLIRSTSKIGKSAGTSVLYLRGITLRRKHRYWWINKYFWEKLNSPYFFNSSRNSWLLLFWAEYIALHYDVFARCYNILGRALFSVVSFQRTVGRIHYFHWLSMFDMFMSIVFLFQLNTCNILFTRISSINILVLSSGL